ncbi:MAG TPA: ribbon-helix-helix domain-containing protein [Candidatus Limnocylindrales bacterium]
MPKERIPARSVRIPDVLWAKVVAKAEREGVSVGEIIRRLLAAWVERD